LWPAASAAKTHFSSSSSIGPAALQSGFFGELDKEKEANVSLQCRLQYMAP